LRKTNQPPDTEGVENRSESVNTDEADATGKRLPRSSDTRCRPCGCVPPDERSKCVVRKRGGVDRVEISFPPGSMGGEMRPFLDQTTREIHWIECACDGGGDGSQRRPVPLASFLCAIHAAAFLGVKRSTLYAWATFLESTDNRGSRLIFWTDALVNDDIPEFESRIPHRADVASERLDRALSGEVLRRGRHAKGCLKTHPEARCTRPPNPDSLRRRSQQWRRDLGKNRKK